MNFFGHAVIACWTRRDAAFVLGAMLPDFATMSGNRLANVEHDELASGVSNHLQVDAVFHATSTFIRLCDGTSERLEAVGVRRGTARAVGHIGTELLLDGCLRERFQVEEPYLKALDQGAPDRLGRRIAWRDPEGAERFEALRARLFSYGLPADFASPQVVLHRLHRALESRPRLRIEPDDAPAVAEMLQELEKHVRNGAEQLIEEVREGLQDREGVEKSAGTEG